MRPSGTQASTTHVAEAFQPVWPFFRSLLAPSQSPTARTHLRAQLPVYCAATLYAAVVAAAIAHHEPWADEAQAWLLARDTSLFDLWTKRLHYEGSPGLWHTVLYVLIRLGTPYTGMNVLSGVLGFAAVWLLLRYAPLPLYIRILLPFTYFLCYQYSVVARSYALLPVLMFACAILFNNALKRLRLFTTLLCLMAAVSVHGFALSISIWLALHLSFAPRWSAFDKSDRRRVTLAAVTYVLALVLIAASAWPASDVAYPMQRDLSLGHLFQVSTITFRDAFTGEWIPSIVIVALSIPFLWRGRGLLVFIVSSALLCGIGALIYTHVWHEGLLFFAWLFAIWVSATNTRPGLTVLAALVVVIAFQCYWTFRSIRYDWTNPYSGGVEAARFLRQLDPPKQRMFGVGFACTAIQPYFPRNVFANVNGGKALAYWDFSTHNRANDVSERLFFQDPDYVVVGYKRPVDKAFWANITKMSGYETVRHFDGDLFWRTGILEAEAFDLYKRGRPDYSTRTVSTVNMADPSSAHQLISGFYDLESGAWRWTARNFSLALKRPAAAAQNGVKLVLHLSLPDVQIQRLGPITLSADIAGRALSPDILSKSGTYTYSRDVPAAAFPFDTVVVSFSLDKSAPSTGSDVRELGVVVTSVSLEPK